ncbi:hypothetical protein BC835DRAFT_508647 [Cytidiella melzeri]|nr:hypothetical protein BC835DRAFT_508647 [Cytidiella melzeri]
MFMFSSRKTQRGAYFHQINLNVRTGAVQSRPRNVSDRTSGTMGHFIRQRKSAAQSSPSLSGYTPGAMSSYRKIRHNHCRLRVVYSLALYENGQINSHPPVESLENDNRVDLPNEVILKGRKVRATTYHSFSPGHADSTLFGQSMALNPGFEGGNLRG